MYLGKKFEKVKKSSLRPLIRRILYQRVQGVGIKVRSYKDSKLENDCLQIR